METDPQIKQNGLPERIGKILGNIEYYAKEKWHYSLPGLGALPVAADVLKNYINEGSFTIHKEEILMDLSGSIAIGTLGAILGKVINKYKIKSEDEKRINAEYETVMNTVDALVVILNKDKEIVYMNKKTEELTGYDLDSIRGESWDMFLNEENKEKVKIIVDKIYNQDSEKDINRNHENSILTKNGEERTILWSNALIDYGDKIRFIIGTGIDITEKKEIENKEKELYKELGKRNGELRRLNKKFEENEKIYSGILKIVAHDIKNPVHVISGYSEMLDETITEDCSPDLKVVADAIKNSSKNLSAIVKSTLEWSNNRMEKMEYSKEPVLLKGIVDEVISMYGESSNYKKIEFENNVHQAHVAYGDSGAITSVVRNLLENSYKFCNVNEGKIKVYSEVIKEGEAEYIAITVEDNGIGMPSQKAKNLFKGISNESGYDTMGNKSTGIGLINCRDAIQNHGGDIEVLESVIDKGTKIRFTLPKNYNT